MSLRQIAVIVALISATGLSAQQTRAEETPTPATTETLSVEQRLAILERKYENDQEAAAAKAKEAANVTAGKDGFQIKSADGNSFLRVSAVFQADYRDFLGDHGSTQFSDQFLLRRVRPTFEGVVNKYIAFRITPDFANGGGVGTTGTASTAGGLLPDAYVELQYIKAARLRFGKFKPPVGLENIQGDPVMFFNERSLATQLVPIRDTGVGLSGEFKEGVFSYQAAIVDGAVDGGNWENDTSDGKDYEGRIFLQPFKRTSSEWINGLGFGVSGSIGDQFGTATTSNLPSYRTDGQQTFFSYSTGTFANGERRRISPQGYWYFTHFGVLAEYVASIQEVARGAISRTVTNRAWQAAGSYVLTGERPSFTGVKVRKNFDPTKGDWGALEVVGRYATLKVDDDALANSFSNPATAARRAKSWSAGLNWYLNNNLRINSDYAVTSFLGGAANGGNRNTEKVVLSRVQVTY